LKNIIFLFFFNFFTHEMEQVEKTSKS